MNRGDAALRMTDLKRYFTDDEQCGGDGCLIAAEDGLQATRTGSLSNAVSNSAYLLTYSSGSVSRKWSTLGRSLIRM